MSKQSELTKRAMEDNNVRMKMAMDDTTKVDDELVWTSSRVVLETWALRPRTDVRPKRRKVEARK